MATRKKKDSIVLEMPGTIGGAKVVLPREKKSKSSNVPAGGWPKIVQGTHLTVKTFEDGRTELVWDDEQLLKEVRDAIASADKTEKAVAEKAPAKKAAPKKAKVEEPKTKRKLKETK